MKIKNVTKNILIVGSYIINPNQEKEFSKDDFDKVADIKTYIAKGYLKELKDIKNKKENIVKTEMKTKSKETDYVVSQSNEPAISYADGKNEVSSFGSESMDSFEGLNGADITEKNLTKENEDLDTDDNLADYEEKTEDVTDTNTAMENEYSMIVKGNGKQGAKIISAKEMKKDIEKAKQQITEHIQVQADEYESITSDDPKVSDFLKKSFIEKKKIIAAEKDNVFLNRIYKVTNSNGLKKIISQRLKELK